MATYPAIYAANMTDQQRAVYYAELSVVQKDEVVGVVLAVFLGIFGAHHFYLRRTGLGILYCFLSVTGLPALLGLVEAFFMPERVRRFNAAQAAAIATHLGYYPGAPAAGLPPGAPAYVPVTGGSLAGPVSVAAVCPSCGAKLAAGVKFCSQCGTPVQA